MWNDDDRVSEENRTVPLFGPTDPPQAPPPDPRTMRQAGDEPRGGTSEARETTRPAAPGWAPVGGTPAPAAESLPGSSQAAMPSIVAVGTVLLDKYRIERKLGEGGMGSVWLVRHIRLDEPRALKVISEGIASDARVRARFELEARILAKLKHPNAVAVHDTGIVGDTAYIEMEYVQGESLRRMIRRGEPSLLPFILWVLRGMCDVLGFAHNKGIVHRDLKPENVMIVSDPETGRQGVKVVDFGIAKIVMADDPAQSMTMHTQGLLGTPAYSSPEQNAFDVVEKTRTPIDHRSDIYSLGVMLYELLTGELPFKGNWTQVLYQHASVAPRPLREAAPAAGIPPALDALVLRCLEKSPDLRPSTAAELYNLFHEAAGRSGALDQTAPGSMPTPAKPPLEILTPHLIRTGQATTSSPPPPLTPTPPPRRWPIVVATAIAGVLTVLAAWNWPGLWREAAPDIPKAERVADGARSGGAAPKPIPPAGVSPAVVEYLRTYHPRRSYVAVEGSTLHELDGLQWPGAITTVGPEDRRRLELRGRVYLPPAVTPDENEGGEGRYYLPLAVQVGDGPSRVEYRLIPEGTFFMGELEERRQTPDDKPYHKVAMSPYYLQATETTVAQFEPFRREAGREWDEDLREYDADALTRVRQAEDDVFPAVWLPRSACEAFAASLGARLPTEAQWEYAARSRGKRESPFVWADADALPAEMANIDDTRLEPRLMAVKSFNTDRTMEGVFDMAGNAREWCRDVHRPYLDSKAAVVDPFEGPREGEPDPPYSIRGGSFMSPRETARVSFRSDLPDLEYKAKGRQHFEDVGFRTVLEVVVARKLDENGRPADGPTRDRPQ